MALRAVCFDFGGTLDAPGLHWLERFFDLYARAGCGLSWEQVRAAFDHATHRAYREEGLRTSTLDPLLRFHVGQQLAHLGLDDPQLAARIVGEFTAAARTSLAESRAVLARLATRYALGVITNFYGNVDRLLDEAGILAMLRVVIDSNRVGVSKPDPEIFRLAVEGFDCAPEEVLYVGDSFGKDIVGARNAGLRTAWLVGPVDRACPDPSLVDFRLRALADLEILLPGGT